MGDAKDRFRDLTCDVMPSKSQWRALLDTNEVNYLVLSVLEQSNAEQILKSVAGYFPNTRFEVFGMPTWKGADILDGHDILPNVGITFTAPFHFDLTTPAASSLAKRYSSTFAGQPAEQVFRGYEVLRWSVYLLEKYGTVFNPKMQDSGAAEFTNFDVKLRKTTSGEILYAENQHLYVLHYLNGSYTLFEQ
jgi:hypothetical protein